jgi:hypothetical protein
MDRTRYEHMRDTLKRQLEAVDREELEALEREARLMERMEEMRLRREELFARFGDDDFEEEAVITFSRTFDSSGRTYHYAAIKAGGKWWLTGRTSGCLTWGDLIDKHLRHSDDVAHVTEVTDI